jgi:RHS repeat-associated protein
MSRVLSKDSTHFYIVDYSRYFQLCFLCVQCVGTVDRRKGQGGHTKYKVDYNVQGLVVAVRDKNDVVRVSFAYNESGQRIRKSGGGKTTFYVRDNSGNVLSVYEQQTVSSDFEQTEVPLYGSGRIGQFRPKDQSYVYEMRDHLGSVRAVILRRLKVGGGVDVLSYSDYYVLGGSVNGGGVPYRHGYQGQYSEKDPETGWDSFELRMYDSKIGRWTTVDPKKQYASPYVGMGNDWAGSVDPDGGYSRIGAFFRWMGDKIAGNDPSKIYQVDDEWGYTKGGKDPAGEIISNFGFPGREKSVNQIRAEQKTLDISTYRPTVPIPGSDGIEENNIIFDLLSLGGPKTLQAGGKMMMAGFKGVPGVVANGISLSARSSRFTVTGVYDITVIGPKFNGRYIGQAKDIARRLKEHVSTAPSMLAAGKAKFTGHEIIVNSIHRLPNDATKEALNILEAEVLQSAGGIGAPGLLNKYNIPR